MEKINSRVAIVTINWNSFEDTSECLESIRKINYAPFEVIVVDNGSKDGSTEKIKESFPEAILIVNQKNEGFSKGNNIGIKLAMERGAEYVFILNNDTIVDPDVLNYLISVMSKKDKIGILSPIIYYYNDKDKIYSAGGKIAVLNTIYHHRIFHKLNKEKELDDVGAVHGCSMFVRKEVFESIGYFDEDYFAYAEDTDFCLRAKKNSFRIAVVPNAKIWHKVSKSTGGSHYSKLKLYLSERGNILFIKKHGNFLSLLLHLVFFVLVQPIAIIRAIVDGRLREYHYRFKGLYAGLLGKKFEGEI